MKDTIPQLHPPKQRRFLRFKQLKEVGIVGDYQTLEDLVEKHGMPRGFKLDGQPSMPRTIRQH